MASSSERPRTLASGGAPVDRRLPSGENKLQRIADHSKSLVDELTEWVELRVKLAQVEVEEKVDAKINKLVVSAIIAVIGALGGFFALVTLALGIGAWLGHPAWGFLVVTVLLLVAAGIVRLAKPHLIKVGDKRAAVSEKKLEHPSSRP